ncbi:MAG: hypothetical protein HRT86_08530 [Ilumatobacteraceae bacterium]|nr:hypothetical protein [Ilumatobacteraceae bacterium]
MERVRSFGASVVGWLVVALLLVLAFRIFFSVFGFLIQMLLILVVLGGLIYVYIRLKAGPPDTP